MTSNPIAAAPESLTLAGDFETPSMQTWAEAVAGVLNKGRPEDKQLTAEQAVARLTTTSVDGLVADPLYVDAAPGLEALGVPGQAPFTRGTTVRSGDMDAWDVRALHEDPDAKATKAAVLEDLERGATSIWLRVDPDAIRVEDIDTDLSDVLLEMAKIDVTSRTNQVAAAEALLKVFEASDKPKDHLSLNLGLDPIGLAALNGGTPELGQLADFVKRLDGYRNSRAIVVDGTVWHNAGAGDVHEVAWLIATAAEYVRALVDAGLSVDDAFDAINFRVSATTDQINTIARLRALRTVWNRVGEIFGASEEHRGARQHAVTSWRQITRDDAYVNILRGTISCFGAAVGGAEAITVLPFDAAWGLPNEFSRRVARNTQILLAEESNIGRVNDPAGGAWTIEAMTTQIAEKAWAEIQRVEAAGGMIAALADGSIQAALDELNTERAKRLATRKLPITGVSEFPNPTEAKLERKAWQNVPQFAGLNWRRDAEVFEELRDATDGTDAKVFLACLGTRRDFGAREGFASNYFHIAGLATPQVDGGSTYEIVAAWQASGTPVVCLCSSAKIYAEQGIEVARALKDAGAKRVLLAGNIKELGDESAGELIDGTIAMGMDVVAGLNEILDVLEVRK